MAEKMSTTVVADILRRLDALEALWPVFEGYQRHPPKLTPEQAIVLTCLEHTDGSNQALATLMDREKLPPPWKDAPKTWRFCTHIPKFNDKISKWKCRKKKQLARKGCLITPH
jgi:hypothetical protein